MPLNTLTTKDTKVHKGKQTRVDPLADLLHEAARIFSGSSAYREAIDLNCRNAHANRHGLSILAAGTNPFVELQIIADHRNTSEHVRAVPDQCRSLDWRSDLPIFDQICF